MDLKEAQAGHQKRHPWETSRLDALRDILSGHLAEGVRVLDVGCGDGFVAETLFKDNAVRSITAVDCNLSEEQLGAFAARKTGISFRKELPDEGNFDLVLLLDVLEHIEKDGAFLKDVVNRHLASKGLVLITVPAFQALFSEHDAFLGHYRRYSLSQLLRLVEGAGLKVRRSGYLFSSLLLPMLVLFKLFGSAASSEGVGRWGRGALLTSLIHQALKLDNKMLLAAGRFGIKIPGLTGWVLCEKQGS
ncbi:class I SAM-dependent methyltransferase [Geomonas nitrogeniifigens]|uniref:class I SAM-dependent methyltransferase n=1 Tax=Geomonas diazotrophica TaxID=2843197 RepID=UPI001C2BB211|nr:methyltransferase domain-containing protein [Geomonas nitrogeniifigens]QXE88272.1 class I SAM-dependent methyltransferase [Geomonas nitrogeniifigens]